MTDEMRHVMWDILIAAVAGIIAGVVCARLK